MGKKPIRRRTLQTQCLRASKRPNAVRTQDAKASLAIAAQRSITHTCTWEAQVRSLVDHSSVVAAALKKNLRRLRFKQQKLKQLASRNPQACSHLYVLRLWRDRLSLLLSSS